MKNKLVIFFALIITGIAAPVIVRKAMHNRAVNNYVSQQHLPAPKDDDDGENNDVKRKLYFENMHRASQGTDWRSVETQNKLNAASELTQLKANLTYAPQIPVTFANGNITGQWTERGNNNLAGRMVAVDYLPSANKLFSISAGGTLWATDIDGSNWEVLNEDYQFSPSELKVFYLPSGGTRILATAYNTLKYSDDNGYTFADATGINFPIEWGANHISSLTILNDAAKTIYCLAYGWDPVTVAPHSWLYRSTDHGASYTNIYPFNNDVDGEVSLYSPYNSAELYILDNGGSGGSSTIYSVSGSNVSILNTTTDLTAKVSCILKGYKSAGGVTLFALTNNDRIYKSINNGANWTQLNGLPAPAWNKFNVSLNDPDKICFAGVEAYITVDGGINWTKVNDWAEYYSSPATKLHADIMALEYFTKTDGTDFIVCNNDGGTYISYDNLKTNSNISLAGLRIGQYYDVLTDPLNANNLFAGSQDQGFQRNISANSTQGLLDFTQISSGDFGDLCLTNKSSHLWTEYPGGNIYYYDNPQGFVTGIWAMPGTQKPEYGWLLPTCNTASATANEIYMAGGNINGGGGSYLVKLAALSPGTFTASQFNYDFRANSNDAASGISAIGVSYLNDNKIYVATEDGTFFYSNNSGSSWAKPVFAGPRPQYLYGATIVPSKITRNVVWYGGSGYSNPPVFKSVDGGQTFIAMSNGLPATLVHEIAASPDERLLFAATEAGPYVYVSTDNTWYSLRSGGVPVQDFFTVEFVKSINTVRFGTFGRGIYDLKLLATLPITLTSFDAQKVNDQKVKLTWTTEHEFNSGYFIVQRSNDAIHFETIDSVRSHGGNTAQEIYNAFDNNPFKEKNFYRLAEKDKDGNIIFSKILMIDFSGGKYAVKLFPNPAEDILNMQMNNLSGSAVLEIIDIAGRKVREEKIIVNAGGTISINIKNLQKGTYNIILQGASITVRRKFIKE